MPPTSPGASNFIGQIDEVSVWNVARSQPELQAGKNGSLFGNEPGMLTGLHSPVPGSLRFEFTEFGPGPYSVHATSDLTLPFASWSNLGQAVEAPVGSGEYLFTDPKASNHPHRVCGIRQP